ncbi:MAG: MucB/RseB C-terminal domain-containing protein, partial [Gammaproteobacteria bacterium]
MEMLKPAVASDGFSWFEHARENSNGHEAVESWKIKKLPKGFLVSSHMRQALPDSDQPTEQWIATDGLASVSIYVEEITSDSDVFTGVMKRGAMNIFGLMLSGHQVTVVGEVPASTVEMIAHSVAMIH